jgi:hypothetical protein
MASPVRPSPPQNPRRPSFITSVSYQVPLESAVPLFEYAKDKGLRVRMEAETRMRGMASVELSAQDDVIPIFENAWKAFWEVHVWLRDQDLTQ